MIFDTHAHLNFLEFEKDRDELISRCLKEGIGMINVGTNYNSSKKAVLLAGSNPSGVFASVGLHPLNIDSEFLKNKNYSNEAESFLEKEFDYPKYKELAESEKVVAIGECGLDYWYRPKGTAKKELFKKEQQRIFESQLDLAEELNLPVIIHCRNAFEDLFNILSKRKIKAVLHCFTGNVFEMERFLSLGLRIGINGIIFKMDLREVLEKVPVEMILIETDCPYLSPPGFEERNNPFALKLIIKEISKIKKIDEGEIAEIASENAINFFKLG